MACDAHVHLSLFRYSVFRFGPWDEASVIRAPKVNYKNKSHTYPNLHPVDTTLTRAYTQFLHHGLHVCRKIFPNFLNGIGELKMKAIKAAYLRDVLVPRVHRHKGRIALPPTP